MWNGYKILSRRKANQSHRVRLGEIDDAVLPKVQRINKLSRANNRLQDRLGRSRPSLFKVRVSLYLYPRSSRPTTSGCCGRNALDPAIPCQNITDNILSFALNHRETHPAYGSGSKGRRRSEADGGDGTGELHGGDVMAPMLGGSLSTGGKPCSSVVGCAEKWDQKHVLVAVVRAFFLMSFPITRVLVSTFVWLVFYGVLFILFLVCDALLTLLTCTCRNSYSRCTGICCLAVPVSFIKGHRNVLLNFEFVFLKI